MIQKGFEMTFYGVVLTQSIEIMLSVFDVLYVCSLCNMDSFFAARTFHDSSVGLGMATAAPLGIAHPWGSSAKGIVMCLLHITLMDYG